MKSLFPIILTMLFTVAFAEEDLEVSADTVQSVLELPPSPDNPRNSEGDFIQLHDGRILFVYTRFTGGSSDHAAAYLASRYSDDGGRSWSDKDEQVIPNEGGMNVMSVSLLRLQNDAIALFYLRKNAKDDCRPLLRISRDEAATWSAPVECIPEPVGYYVVNNDRIIQTTSGRLIIPAALHALKGETFSSRGRVVCYLSDDNGATWKASETMLEAPESIKTGFQEPGVVQLPGGKLLMLLRNSSGVFYRSSSEDNGLTWSEATPTDLKTPVSPASFELLPDSATLLLVWNDHADIAASLKGKRTPLVLALSKDNGNSWPVRYTLEDNPQGWYCYTAIAFTESHLLLGYCAGDTATMPGLSLTRITRISIDFLKDL